MMDRRDFLFESIALVVGAVATSELSAETQFPVRFVNNKVCFTGKVTKADVPNGNKRLYPRALLEREVAKFQEVIKQRGWMGQIGMPTSSILQFKEASHIVTRLEMEGDYMVADIEALNTPMGRVLKSMLQEDGMSDPVALRTAGVGYGRVNDEGILIIDDSFKLISVNVVSAKDAANIF
jgi:hypothetical protein